VYAVDDAGEIHGLLESARERLALLRLCGILDVLVEDSSRLVSRYSAYLSSIGARGFSGEAERVRRVLEGIELVNTIAVRARSRLCSGRPGLSAVYDVLSMFEKHYPRLMTGSLLVPASLRQAYYEAFSLLRSLTATSPLID